MLHNTLWILPYTNSLLSQRGRLVPSFFYTWGLVLLDFFYTSAFRFYPAFFYIYGPCYPSFFYTFRLDLVSLFHMGIYISFGLLLHISFNSTIYLGTAKLGVQSRQSRNKSTFPFLGTAKALEHSYPVGAISYFWRYKFSAFTYQS